MNQPAPPEIMAPDLVISNAELAERCAHWSAAGIVGVDTEFVRERTYFPRPALVQVTDGQDVVLIDPLETTDLSPLNALLADTSIIKLMHACSEDLEVLELLTGASPQSVFDSQLAGAFAGYGVSLGYRALVEALLEVYLDKGETRSDWLRRPLSSAQLSYAALDVAYLLPMYRRLAEELRALNRDAWLEEELQHQRRSRALDKQPDSAWSRVRGGDALPPADHAVLRALSEWREREAMSRDMPRRHLLTDEVLIKLSAETAPSAVTLRNIQGFSQRSATRYGETIIRCIETARINGPAEVDSAVDLRPYAGTIKRLKRAVRQVADRLELPPELLASRRALESLLISVLKSGGEIPLEFRGWRYDVITRTLLDCINESN